MANYSQKDDQTKVPSSLVTRTAKGTAISVAKMVNSSVNLAKYETINERLEILEKASLGDKAAADFVLDTIMIGVGGHEYLGTNSQNVSVNIARQHQPSDLCAFTPIPFVMRLLEDDITDDQRANLCLRRVITQDDKKYVQYWGYLVNTTNVVPKIATVRRDTDNLVDSDEGYEPKKTDIYPVPVPLNTDGSVPLSDLSLAVIATMDCTLDAWVTNEIRNACSLLYGTPNMALISEWSVCWGIPTPVDGASSNGSTIRYNDRVGVVPMFHLTEASPRNGTTNSSIPMVINLGSQQPMLLHTSRTVEA